MRRSLNVIIPVISLAFMSACVSTAPKVTAEQNQIVRHHFNDYEIDLGFTQAIQVGKTLYISGVPAGGKDMEEALTIVYQRIADILKRFDATPNHIVKETVYVTDMEAMKRSADTRKAFFTNNEFPTSTWVEITRLYDQGYLVEVDVVVQLP